MSLADTESEATRPRAVERVDLTTTKPGTPGGSFMRRFWHAIRRSEDLAPGLIETWAMEEVPCNYLQCFENSMGEVHVAFVHRPGF